MKYILLSFLFCFSSVFAEDIPPEKLAKWLERFPDADTDEDGLLSIEEADAYRQKIRNAGKPATNSRKPLTAGGAPRVFEVDPGWDDYEFPDHAVSNRPPAEIARIYGKEIVSFDKPVDGALRIVGTGHSFMAPGYGTLPRIVKAAGFADQPLHTHTGGGMTGSARYKWEQENGIFQFDRKPVPKLLASIANAEWDVMMWGPYFQDRPQYYSAWINFALQYQPGMKFYLSDAWPQLHQLGEEVPDSEDVFTQEVFDRIGTEKRELYTGLIAELRESHGDSIFVLPTSDAMTLAAKAYLRGELPGVEGINRILSGKEKSLWRDQLGHLGPGFERLEGYVFYATLYGKSPDLIEGDIAFANSRKLNQPGYPSEELDRIFRKIAWEAVTGHRFSGITDEDGDGLADSRE